MGDTRRFLHQKNGSMLLGTFFWSAIKNTSWHGLAKEFVKESGWTKKVIIFGCGTKLSEIQKHGLRLKCI